MSETLYVGIDVAKLKLDVAISINGKDILASAVFNNDLKDFKKLLSLVKKHLKKTKCKSAHYCLEATGIYHQNITEFLQEHTSDIVSVVNPLQTKSFAKSLLLRTKNDKVDAQMLTLYAFFHKPSATPKMPEGLKEFRSLVRHLDSLIANRTQELTRLKSSVNKDVCKFITKKISFIEKQIQDIEILIKEQVKSDLELQTQVNLLKTVDCIGDKTAWKIISEIKIEDPNNISVKAQVAHAGLSPKERTSGSSVRGRSHICKTGNASLRKSLYMPAVNCIKQKNYFYEFYFRLVSNGKPKKVAIIAVMRKMLATAVGVLKNQQPFDRDWVKKKQEEYLIAA